MISEPTCRPSSRSSTGKEIHRDSQGNNIDFSPFRTKGTASNSTTPNGCAVGLTSDNGYNLATFTTVDNSGVFGGNGGVGFNLSSANEHYVNIHRAQLPFTATDTARMTGRPPAIGLLQTVGGQFNPENTSTLASGIKGAQLTYYLKSAGLDFSGASGCPSGGFNVNNSVTESDPALTSGKTNTQIFCPNGGVSGQVFDYLDAIDIANGLLSNYSVVWIPHFQTLSGASLPSPCRTGVYTSTNNCESQAMTQVGSFLTSQNHGFMGECITISSLEGASGIPTLTSTTQTLTCPDGGSGLCGSGTTTTGLTINNSNYENLRLDNCSNPAMPANSGSSSNGYTDAVTTTANGITCMNYGSPGSPFAQIGDFRWFAYSGGTDNYSSINSGSSQTTYKPGVITLAYTVGSLNTATLATNPRSLASVDDFSFIQRDNNANEAQVVYLAGHNYTGDVAGTRVALNTVLALGLIVTTNESAFVGATLYQGTVFVPTYYGITTVSPLVEWRVFNPSLGSKWHFPYHTGNLRIHSLETNYTVDSYANYTSVGGTSFFQGNQASGTSSPIWMAQ